MYLCTSKITRKSSTLILIINKKDNKQSILEQWY